MSLGGCIILLAVGAVLTFATDWHMKGVNLDLVGIIFMAVGLIGIMTFSSIARRRRVVMPNNAPVVEEDRHHHHHHGTGPYGEYGDYRGE